ncbi:hypothetical protein SSX86_000012 [Deinandra increscens subsp. villosa]|uniref:Uncharacterized protein n=1 Tax=Deinandra increscens subsp. villosa TaxID=3103831 RepID=A0AAP0DWU1_9ASTR
MAAASVGVVLPLPSSKSTVISTTTSLQRLSFTKVPYYKNVSTHGRLLSVRAQIATDAEALAKVEKVSKKQEEGVVTNKYRPKEPYVGRCLLNTKITGDDAPGETWHMVFSTEGML